MPWLRAARASSSMLMRAAPSSPGAVSVMAVASLVVASEQRSPGELGVVAEQAAGLVDAEQGAVLGQVALDGNAGEDLGHEVAAGAAHDGVGGGDDERLGPGDVGLKGTPHGLGDMGAVDVAPQVPPAQLRVVPEGREPLVVVPLH